MLDYTLETKLSVQEAVDKLQKRLNFRLDSDIFLFYMIGVVKIMLFFLSRQWSLL